MKLLTWMSVGLMGLGTFTVSAEAAPADNEHFYEDANKSDSGIIGPPYAKIVAELDSLAKAYPEWVDRFQYGTTLQGRPLVALKISKKLRASTPGAKQAILIAGSIHGNEYLNVEDRLPRWIIEQGLKDLEVKKFFDNGGVALLAPILNPDGYENRQRENMHDVDLNRDFTIRKKDHFAFKEPETKALSEFVADQVKDGSLRLALTMDYHCCIGAVLRPWSFKAPNPPRADVDRFNVVGGVLKSVFGKRYQYGTTPDILKYEAVGTSKDYYYESYGAVGLTFEGKYGEEAKRFPEHTKMWQQIFLAVNAGKI